MPKPPPHGLHVWAWFAELMHERDHIGMGGVPALLKSRDILAWCQLSRQWPEPWELDTIRRLDRLWIAARTSELAAK